MEHSLNQALQTLSTPIDEFPLPVIVTSPEGIVHTWNRAVAALLGVPGSEAVGAPLPVGLSLSALQASACETECRARDGRPLPLSVSSVPLRNADGSLAGFASLLYDLSSSRRTEQELQAAQLCFRVAFDQSAVGMAHATLDGRFTLVNDRLCEILGYSREELLQLNIREITHPEDVIRHQPIVHALRSGEQSTSSLEKRILRKDGSEVWIAITAYVARGPSGEPLYFMGVIRDITERRAAEAALQASESLFRAFVENAPDGIFVDAHLEIQYINPAAVRMLHGASASQFLGRSVRDFVEPADHVSLLERSAAITAGMRVPTAERRYRCLDGEPLPVEVSASPIEYDHRPAALVFLHDIGQRRRDAEQRARLEQQLAQSQKLESIGRLAGGVAHDFNNHLTVINGYCEMILERLGAADPLRAELTEIRAAADRAAALTTQLLAFSRRQVVSPVALSLNHVISEAGNMLRRLIREDIGITTSLDPSLGSILADRGQMNQLLMNLVINARDAMPDGGEITVETSSAFLAAEDVALHPNAQPGRYALLTVSDTGTGMDQETVARIFEPFFSTKGHRGTGLGLSTVYGIVQQAGGWISVDSRPGRGTRFDVWFPVVDRTPQSAPSPLAELPVSTSAAETILVVEDQPHLRNLTASILRNRGYNVLESADGPAALELAAHHGGPIHLLFTDIVLPGLTGRELAARLGESHRGLKVLFTSGYTADITELRGVPTDGAAYLPKPFTPAELCARVKDVLTQPAP